MTARGDIVDYGGTVKKVLPNLGTKIIQVVTDDTIEGGADTFTVDLKKYGCNNLHGIVVNDETTTGSAVVQAAPTTVVTAGVVTITLGGSATCVKSILLFAY